MIEKNGTRRTSATNEPKKKKKKDDDLREFKKEMDMVKNYF
jgi:hypothetical protein